MATSLGASALSSLSTSDSDAPPDSATPGEPQAPSESGIPPGPRRSASSNSLAARGEAHLLSALASGARTEAALGGLFRTLQHLAAGVSGAREANDQLLQELEVLREVLGSSNAQQSVLRHRVHEFEQSRFRAEQEAERDRKFLIDEQDAFIVSLCVDHEREIAELLADRDRALSSSARLESQCNQAQTALVRIASERDQALIELSRVNASLSSRSIALKLELESPEPTPSTLIDSVPPPEELRAELTPSPQSSKPPLRQKPDPSTRPLIGYSVAGQELEPEHLEGASISSRPSRP